METPNGLVPALKESLFNPTYDIALEYAEIGIDALLNNEALKSIPFVNTITAICKIGYNVHERSLIRQTLSFISEFSKGTISSQKLEEYKRDLESNPKKAEKELGRVIVILGSHIEEIQSKVLAGFYRAFVFGAISWEKFCELSEVNRRMFVSDYPILLEAAKNEGLDIEGRELYQVDRLISLGMLQNSNRSGPMWIEGMGSPNQKNDIIITSLGKTFYQHMPRK